MFIYNYRVKENDTLQSIAEEFYGDAEQWNQLVSYNNLDYPYISSDTTVQRDLYASGSVTFTASAPVSNPITIPQGTILSIPAGRTNFVRTYVTQVEATIPAESTSVTVAIVSTYPGDIGNVPGGKTWDTSLALTATNPSAITGGAVLNILFPGDTLLIPLNSEPTSPVTTAEEYGGYDLLLTDVGDLAVDATGDLAYTVGRDTIGEDIKWMIRTEKGELLQHPQFGTVLLDIATSGLSSQAIKTMSTAEIQSVILQHPLVQNVTNLSWSQQGSTATITGMLVLYTNPQPINFSATISA